MAIDIGGKRTGIAIGDGITLVACPVEIIESSGDEDLIQKLIEMFKAQEPDELIVGLPLNMDDTLSPGCERIRSIMKAVTQTCPAIVHEVDERLTSFEIDDRLKQSGLTRKGKKKRQDALVACLLLEDFWRR